MKAAVYNGKTGLEVMDVQTPVIGEDDILIKIDSCSICGSDLRILDSGFSRVKPGTIMGHEIAGTIIGVGVNQKQHYNVSQKVALGADIPCGGCEWCKQGLSNNCQNTIAFGHEYPGGFAQFLKIDKRIIDFGPFVVLDSPKVSQDELSLAEPLACCINGFEHCGTSLGKSVLIFGAGPIGILLAMLSKTLGATRVVLTDISIERLQVAEVAHADQYVPTKEIDKIIKKQYFDIVITACPSLTAQADAFRFVRKKGIVNFFGGLKPNSDMLEIDTNLIHYNELTVLGSHGSTPLHHKIAVDMIVNKRIIVQDLITKTYVLDNISQAFEDLKENKSNLKIVIKP